MTKEQLNKIYEKASDDLDRNGKVDYMYLFKEYGLSPETSLKDVHIRIMSDENVIIIKEEDNYIWDVVDEAILNHRSVN